MNVYHVIYNQTDGNTGEVFVVASTDQLAANAAQANDATFVSLVTVEQICSNVITGS